MRSCLVEHDDRSLHGPVATVFTFISVAQEVIIIPFLMLPRCLQDIPVRNREKKERSLCQYLSFTMADVWTSDRQIDGRTLLHNVSHDGQGGSAAAMHAMRVAMDPQHVYRNVTQKQHKRWFRDRGVQQQTCKRWACTHALRRPHWRRSTRCRRPPTEARVAWLMFSAM